MNFQNTMSLAKNHHCKNAIKPAVGNACWIDEIGGGRKVSKIRESLANRLFNSIFFKKHMPFYYLYSILVWILFINVKTGSKKESQAKHVFFVKR